MVTFLTGPAAACFGPDEEELPVEKWWIAAAAATTRPTATRTTRTTPMIRRRRMFPGPRGGRQRLRGGARPGTGRALGKSRGQSFVVGLHGHVHNRSELIPECPRIGRLLSLGPIQ